MNKKVLSLILEEEIFKKLTKYAAKEGISAFLEKRKPNWKNK